MYLIITKTNRVDNMLRNWISAVLFIQLRFIYVVFCWFTISQLNLLCFQYTHPHKRCSTCICVYRSISIEVPLRTYCACCQFNKVTHGRIVEPHISQHATRTPVYFMHYLCYFLTLLKPLFQLNTPNF